MEIIIEEAQKRFALDESLLTAKKVKFEISFIEGGFSDVDLSYVPCYQGQYKTNEILLNKESIEINNYPATKDIYKLTEVSLLACFCNGQKHKPFKVIIRYEAVL